MTQSQAQKVVTLVVVGLLLLMGTIVYVFITNYNGRVDLVASNRAGCERAKLDRGANASGWRTAETARVSSLAKQMHIPFDRAFALTKKKPALDDPADLIAARKYNEIASGLEVRSVITCSEVFPKARFFP